MRRATWPGSIRTALASGTRLSLVCAVLVALAAAPPGWRASGFRFTRSLFAAPHSTLTLSIVGTSDLHGYFMERGGRGGIALFAGYVNNLRAARAADGGAVLLLDAGDTFQGGVESNLSEGAVVVDAYNAMGYTALSVGNHEFDFGSADRPGARQDPAADPQGALKARAAQAKFPFLAANLLDDRTGARVDWPNVQPSTMVDVARHQGGHHWRDDLRRPARHAAAQCSRAAHGASSRDGCGRSRAAARRRRANGDSQRTCGRRLRQVR